ncbi:MAG: tRNA (adenosine(37)-N6)-threonylcarbamoyltransferase complex ATPase subunit type 1 TsaE [Rhodobacteraceae bacterium CG17_big_fil_post_rev_8_21_14_2_50_63_15]|nr:tRNA (adenosine(37)-N6)-threonylcarbamoyltransferase complex ATPase subunit type 1 TsaE [Roseovarius sp.]PIV78392.1 MAG: tRNA (adenosine(37)-N6)-threonylcarbamoyltransferase complex ATPase subunit type 1 TsaE [Rhodobacteraceae bacterium CG17_big_fil_post_rev_8_21_14_2_50_63_15]
MSEQAKTLTLANPEATCALAQALAPRLEAGDVLLLSGGVGAGKTHFARCLIQGLLAVPEDIPSPTYTLVQTYPGARADIWHADLYRLSDPLDLIELGLTEAFSDAICLVEWPDRLGDLIPPTALSLAFAPGAEDDQRQLRLTWSDARWRPLLSEILDA